jgi:uncharacterized protein YhaN
MACAGSGMLAVLVAVVTVLGHRTHTEAVLYQAKASDQWNFYQAKNIRATISDRASGLLSVTNAVDKDKAQKLAKDWADKQAKWAGDLKDEEEKARQLEEKVEQAEARARPVRSGRGAVGDCAGDGVHHSADP